MLNETERLKRRLEFEQRIGRLMADRIVHLAAERDKYHAALGKIRDWLVCHPIASNEDMAQSFSAMLELIEKAFQE